MTVLSDKWIKQNAKEKGRFLLVYLPMDTMQESQMSLKFLQMLIQV